MRVGIVGAGRLGRSLAALAERAGLSVELAGRGGDPDVDVVLLTVPDRAIAEAAALITRAPIVLHCSGATGVDVLRPHAPAGSLHPLMTFPGVHALPALAGVPAAIDGDPEAVRAATAIAVRLGMTPLHVPGDRRLYHAAAVIAGNFATVLFAEAARVLEAAGVPPDRATEALLPLALQSLRNAAADPDLALTGPAARGDAAVLAAHREALAEAGLEDVRALYDALTERTSRRVATKARNPLRGTVV